MIISEVFKIGIVIELLNSLGFPRRAHPFIAIFPLTVRLWLQRGFNRVMARSWGLTTQKVRS